ncbi:Hypothetical predicted protein, partial [Pelobates cultripes]
DQEAVCEPGGAVRWRQIITAFAISECCVEHPLDLKRRAVQPEKVSSPGAWS